MQKHVKLIISRYVERNDLNGLADFFSAYLEDEIDRDLELKNQLSNLVASLHKVAKTKKITKENWDELIADNLRDLSLLIENQRIGTPTARVYKFPIQL